MYEENTFLSEYTGYTVRQAIYESAYFLALLSKKSLSEHGPTQHQLRIALRKNEEHAKNTIIIIPVRIDDCKIEQESLLDIQPLDLFQSPETELEKLLRVFIHENCGEKNGNSPCPFPQMDTKSVRKLIEKFKTSESDPKPPHSRKRLIWGICFLLMLIIGLWYIFSLIHFHPKPVDDYLKSATRFLNRGMYSEALAQYEQALKLCPECPIVLTGRKKTEFFREVAETDFNPGALIERLKNIPGVSEDDLHVRLLTGNINAQMGKGEKAESIYLEITRKEPEFAEAWFSLGVLYHKQGNREQARNMYEKAVRISENNFRYLDNLAWIDLEAGQYQSAVQSYKKMLAADNNFLLAYAEIAKALWMDKKPKKALFYQRNLIKKMENPRIAYYPLNKDPWFFPLKDESVILDKQKTKKYYAAYSLAGACYLLGSISEAETYVEKAEKIQIGPVDAITIRTLIDQDISEIQEKYAEVDEIKNRAKEFRRLITTPRIKPYRLPDK